MIYNVAVSIFNFNMSLVFLRKKTCAKIRLRSLEVVLKHQDYEWFKHQLHWNTSSRYLLRSASAMGVGLCSGPCMAEKGQADL